MGKGRGRGAEATISSPLLTGLGFHKPGTLWSRKLWSNCGRTILLNLGNIIQKWKYVYNSLVYISQSEIWGSDAFLELHCSFSEKEDTSSPINR